MGAMTIILFFLIPLSLTLLVTPIIIYIAQKCNCIDNPGKRKFHRHPTPRWGGVAFFIGILPAFVFLKINSQIASYLIAVAILVILGGIDDRKNISWRIKFLGMFIAASIVIFGGDAMINNIGRYGSYGKVELGMLSIPITYFAVIGVTNAINLIDGLNGLAGGVSLIAFLFIGIAAYLSGNYLLATIAIAFVGVLIGFLLYNFPKAKIFMGDSGSLFLGFSLAIFSIFLTQGEMFHVEPMFPVLVLLIPIFDTLRIMAVRSFNLKNPFAADKIHLHHLLIRKGISPVKTVVFLWSLTFIFCLIATLLIERASTSYLVLVLMISLILSFYADALCKRDRRKTK